jgi:hypothetical protein
LLASRGTPIDDSSKTHDGWSLVQYGEQRPLYFYYFSTDDSIVEWARVFVIDGYTAARVHQAFGKPDTVEFGDDLSKREEFKTGLVTVAYRPSGDVDFVEYHTDLLHNLGVRRAARADAAVDSALAAVIAPGSSTPDSASLSRARKIREARSLLEVTRTAPHAPTLSRTVLRLAAQYDSLCALAGCDLIYSSHRAWDRTP